jgi:hypothetical protein
VCAWAEPTRDTWLRKIRSTEQRKGTTDLTVDTVDAGEDILSSLAETFVSSFNTGTIPAEAIAVAGAGFTAFLGFPIFVLTQSTMATNGIVYPRTIAVVTGTLHHAKNCALLVDAGVPNSGYTLTSPPFACTCARPSHEWTPPPDKMAVSRVTVETMEVQPTTERERKIGRRRFHDLWLGPRTKLRREVRCRSG